MILRKDIITDDNPLLRQKSVDVTLPLSKEDEKLLDDMMEYLENSQDEEKSKELDIQPSKIITKDGCHELHFNYINKSGIISWENASDILLEVISPFLGKEKILAELKSKYNLIYDIPIDSDAVDIESVIVLDGKVTNFLYDSKIKENLKWYFF